MRIGIDIGRVIIGPRIAGVEDTSFLGRSLAEALHTPPAAGSFDVIAQLVHRAEGAVWLVSKAGPSVQRKTRAWLDHVGFHEATGLARDRVRFCLHRADKADHARELALTHFIDDRVDVLRHLRGLVPTLMLFGEREAPAPPWCIAVPGWTEVAAVFARP